MVRYENRMYNTELTLKEDMALAELRDTIQWCIDNYGEGAVVDKITITDRKGLCSFGLWED